MAHQTDARVPAFLFGGKILLQARSNRGHFRLRLLDADAGSKPRYRPDIVRTAKGRFLVRERHRKPNLRAGGKFEIAAHHADDRLAQAIDGDFFAENIGISAEPPHPKSVAQDHFLIVARLLFFRQESPSELWWNLENIEEICG